MTDLDSILEKLSEDEQEVIKGLIDSDTLTTAYNRRKFNRDIDREVNRAEHTGQDVSLLMLDIDYFKKVNDTQGHLYGDNVLIDVVKTAQAQLHNYDMVYRYGGEELAVILPNTTTEQGYNIAERIRQQIEQNTSVTVSIGVANYKGNAATVAELISYADRGLYDSKRQGRNQTQIYKKES